MTKRDYKLIAETIANLQGRPLNKPLLARVFATALAKDNPRFDHRKFMEACGL